MDRMISRAFAALAVLSGMLVPGSALAGWTATAGDLGRDDNRFAVHAGFTYGVMDGSEIQKADPSSGFDIGASFRFLGSLSVVAMYAVDGADVDGQLTALVDQSVRPDGRSGYVIGRIETSRLRTGIRVDAYRERDWRLRPYLLGAVVFSTIDVTIDSVNGVSPPPRVPGAQPGETRDISSFSQSQIGGLARVGLEIPVASSVALDISGNIEVIEMQPGTNSIFGLNSGLTVRF